MNQTLREIILANAAPRVCCEACYARLEQRAPTSQGRVCGNASTGAGNDCYVEGMRRRGRQGWSPAAPHCCLACTLVAVSFRSHIPI
ncbi:hypothetical protein E2C01_088877 [Portunus trituberculatus]|uniref:Uncharacterized protein n=1 Tax=Portunus trituberculatus TaxID=210409 RepID=A0A5B7JKS3_PORTR|nr:hypothetical protein [Portunus trituberculatus]